MKAVARLLLASFSSKDWITMLGVIGVVWILLALLVGVLGAASITTGAALRSAELAACGAFFMASMYLPSAFSRLVRSHSIDLLPRGRLKLLASALTTILIVSTPIPFAIIAVMKTAGPYGLQNREFYGAGITALDYIKAPFFWYLFELAVLGYTWLYIVMWSAAGVRSGSNGASFRTLFVLLVLPIPFLRILWLVSAASSIAVTTTLIAVMWSGFAIGFLLVPRLTRVANGQFSTSKLVDKWFRAAPTYAMGDELRLVLGMASARFDVLVTSALCMVLLSAKAEAGLVIFATLIGLWVGGFPALAASRARSLWLRRQASREELFALVERLFWRHASLRLAVMFAWLIPIAVYKGFTWTFVAVCLVHVAVTVIASIYLGLIQTSRRVGNAFVATGATLLAIMGAVASSGDLEGVILVSAILAAVTSWLRQMARRRWRRVDWSGPKLLKAS